MIKIVAHQIKIYGRSFTNIKIFYNYKEFYLACEDTIILS